VQIVFSDFLLFLFRCFFVAYQASEIIWLQKMPRIVWIMRSCRMLWHMRIWQIPSIH